MSRPAPTAAEPPPLRLGVGHLLLWITLCGLVLTGYRLLNDPADLLPEERSFADAFQIVMAIGYSLAVTAIVVPLFRRRRGDRRFPTHAGHWLAIMGVITLAIDGGSLATVKLIAVWQERRWTDYWNVYQAGAWGLGTAVGLVLLIFVRQEWRWRVVVAGIVAFTGLHAVEYGGLAMGTYLESLIAWHDQLAMAILLVGLAAVIFAAAGDLANKTRRDWLHWSGAIAWLGLIAMQIAAIVSRWKME
jgi:hypothetical protein